VPLLARRPLFEIEPSRGHDLTESSKDGILVQLAAGSGGEHKLTVLPQCPSPRLLGSLALLVLAKHANAPLRQAERAPGFPGFRIAGSTH
jgi:hypothetical protein